MLRQNILKTQRNRAQRLAVEILEDRTLPSFVTAPTYAVGAVGKTAGSPIAIVTGDFNGDGIVDIATANQGSDTLSILYGVGNGTFKPAATIPLGLKPTALIAADLTGDGRLDLITADGANDSVSVLINEGGGKFKSPVTYPAGDDPVALAAADFNGDEHEDLAVVDNGAATVTLLMGNGKGSFTSGATVNVASGSTSIAVGDFNNSGLDSIATVSGGFGYLDVNLNDGHGNFSTPVNYKTGFCATSVVVGDFSGDEQPDLAVACGFPSSDGVSVLLGNADGTFQPFVNYSLDGQTPATLAVGDLTGNGIEDIVTANGQFANNSVSVLPGNGDGTFGAARTYTAGQSPDAIALGDFNRDGFLDVAVADQDASAGATTGNVAILLGNGDGSLLAAPDLVVPGAGPAVEADFNGDGIPDLAVITSSTSYSGVLIFPGLGNGWFGAPIETAPISGATSIAAGEFNSDGRMDLAVTNSSGVNILMGNGDGAFGSPQLYAAGPSPSWLDVVDLTGNGIDDLIVADNGTGGSISILLGNGDGTFQPATSVSAGGEAKYVAVGDLNGDHIPDLAVVNANSNTMSVVLGKGDGTFGSAKSYTTQNGPGMVAIGDFDGDRPGLAVPTFFGSGASSELSILLQGTNGIFADKYGYTTGSLPTGIAISDLTNNGKQDLVTVNDFSDDIDVFMGTGTGAFGTPSSYVVGDRPTYVTAADFNGDGLPDLAVVNSNSGTVTLLETPENTATHFRVSIVPTLSMAGTSSQVVVTALNSADQVMTGYTGTVSFSSTDSQGILPTAYKFKAADDGVHRFTVTFRTAGQQSVTVHSGAATGTASMSVVAAAASHFQVSAAPEIAGTPFNVTLTALDPYGNVATSFTGTVHLTTNDLGKGVALPPDYSFTSNDSGEYTFAGVTLITAGERTISATDVAAPTVKGTANITVNAAEMSGFLVAGIPLSAVASKAYTFTVAAVDAYGNTIANYLGAVQFSFDGGTAILPEAYTFTTLDKGKHTFQATLQTIGADQSLTAADESDINLSGSEMDIDVK